MLVEESRRIPNPIAVIVIGYTLRDLTAVHLLHTGTHLTHRELACTAQLLAVVFTSTGQCVPSQRFYRQKAKLHDPRALACGRPRLLLPAAAERCGGFPRTNRFKHDPGRTVTTACCALGTAAPSARSPRPRPWNHTAFGHRPFLLLSPCSRRSVRPPLHAPRPRRGDRATSGHRHKGCNSD